MIYLSHAASMPESYRIVAAADRNPPRVERARALSANPSFRGFSSVESLLGEPRCADLLIIGTQDADHHAHASAALHAGYDLLLEKPIASTLSQVYDLARTARRNGRRVLVCHVLRYTAFYRRIAAVIQSGAIGGIVAFEATQGLDPWHHAHSYVRGHWAVAEQATPLTVANACHDFDILSWLIDSPCRTVSSFGGIGHFSVSQAPAGAPARCSDGCPVADTCLFDSHRYLCEKRPWLKRVWDRGADASDYEIMSWLRTSKWGRCVYRCDNTSVDHQTTCLEFDSGATGSLTLTAFSQGRDLALFGTRGRLLAGPRVRRMADCDLLVERFDGGPTERISLPGDDNADATMMQELPLEWRKSRTEDMSTSLERSIESHLIGFTADVSRQTGRTVHLADIRDRQTRE